MAEFMAQAHEKRLEAMDQVKAEVQRGYEQQIADLQAKVRCYSSCSRCDRFSPAYCWSCLIAATCGILF